LENGTLVGERHTYWGTAHLLGNDTLVGEWQAGVALVVGTNSSIELLLQDADAPDAKVV
jgi:hypothetical protein